MRFEKVSYEQYEKDCKKDEMYSSLCGYLILESQDTKEVYNHIKLPERATSKSAGYDFYAPYDFKLNPGDTIKLATGIRVILDDDKVLICAPRSSHGFKARIQLDNTIGVIDADYSDSSNEGHIHLKLTNDSNAGKSIFIKKGEAVMQGIIMQYFTVDDDNVTRVRDGGLGSTSK